MGFSGGIRSAFIFVFVLICLNASPIAANAPDARINRILGIGETIA